MKNKLLLLSASLIVVGLLIEILCRLTGYHISYGERSSSGGYNSPFKSRNEFGYGWDETPRPFTEQRINKLEFQHTWMSNNEGLRGGNIALQKKGKRVLVFGDSFTEGMGAPDDSTYPQLLENLIHLKLDSSAEVINCGPSGSDLFTEYKLFTLKMLKYQPDVVLVTFNGTDLYEFTVRGGFERFKENNRVEYRTPPWFEPLYAKSYLVRFWVHDVLRYDYRFLRPSEGEAMNRLSIQMNRSVVDSFNLLCKANNCKFGMVFHPMRNDFRTSDYQNEQIISYCRQKNIPYADNYEYLNKMGINETNADGIYWAKDGHFNPKGYELLAKCAYELFEKNGWLSDGGQNYQQ